ncbi:MAG: glycosyltransferase [Candidatus Nomurabacteria bacterium]|jgi:glycosyltransferase involved in cell wall biosynthesis|nr:glycosyltransferase [Candidatus Nomurabacteria bacterium]
MISVIVPIYRAEKYLPRCIDSIIESGIDDYELILVDDGSPDNSGQIADDYAARNPEHIKVVHQLNRGHTLARQAGLKMAKGDYIWLVDSDDYLAPDALAKIATAIAKHQPDIITFDNYFEIHGKSYPGAQSVPYGVFDKAGLMKKIYPHMIYSGNFFYFGIYAAMWNKVFRRSIIEPNLMAVDPAVKIHEDGLATFASFLDAKLVVILKQKLYHYRKDNSSVTRSYCPEQFPGLLILADSLEKINREKAIYDLSEQINFYLLYNIFSIIFEEFYFRHAKPRRERRSFVANIINHRRIKQALASVDLTTLPPRYQKFFSLMLSHKNRRLIAYTMRLAYQKRCKLLVKKILRR